jgi:hypothetical protein
MYHLFLVDMKQRNANHSENSKNLLLWDELFFMFLDDIAKTLVALFHNDARIILLVFHKIDHSHDQWVIYSP